MVMLYVAGKPVGPLAEVERLLPELVRDGRAVEFRDDARGTIGTFTPRPPDEPLVPWDPSIDMAELERRMAEPGYTLEEMKKRLGWQ